MRRIITRGVAAIALVVVSLVGFQASPAAAHHTHSPTTLCNWYRPGGYTSLTPHSHYYTSGHPATAHCYYRSNTTFQLYVTCRWYDTHAFASGCAHG